MQPPIINEFVLAIRANLLYNKFLSVIGILI